LSDPVNSPINRQKKMNRIKGNAMGDKNPKSKEKNMKQKDGVKATALKKAQMDKAAKAKPALPGKKK
jgi:hypothetical protein